MIRFLLGLVMGLMGGLLLFSSLLEEADAPTPEPPEN